MPEIPKRDKKCVECGAPAQCLFTEVEGGKAVGSMVLCNDCALKKGMPPPSPWTDTPFSKLGFLVSFFGYSLRRRDNLDAVHGFLKSLTGEDLPAQPSVWRQWLKEHPGFEVEEEKFSEILSALGFRVGPPSRTGLFAETDLSSMISFLQRIPENKLEFLVNVLEEAIESSERGPTIHAHLKEITGEDLPCDYAAWWKWMEEHLTDIKIDDEKLRRAITELEIGLSEIDRKVLGLE